MYIDNIEGTFNLTNERVFMIEKAGETYPVYVCPKEREGVQSHKALLALSYEQILEVANVMFYFDNVMGHRSRFLGGVRLDEKVRALHTSIHNAAVNCCLSLEEADRCEKEGGSRA
jgi:hypothetical protein